VGAGTAVLAGSLRFCGGVLIVVWVGCGVSMVLWREQLCRGRRRLGGACLGVLFVVLGVEGWVRNRGLSRWILLAFSRVLVLH
jgi:hypothetical protein